MQHPGVPQNRKIMFREMSSKVVVVVFGPSLNVFSCHVTKMFTGINYPVTKTMSCISFIGLILRPWTLHDRFFSCPFFVSLSLFFFSLSVCLGQSPLLLSVFFFSLSLSLSLSFVRCHECIVHRNPGICSL